MSTLLSALNEMTSRELFKLLNRLGCELHRTGKGSHQVWTCGECRVSIPNHSGDIPKGTLRAIERALEPCLGKSWMK